MAEAVTSMKEYNANIAEDKFIEKRQFKIALMTLLAKITIIVFVVVLFLFVIYGIRIAKYKSMEPNIMKGDMMLLYRLNAEYNSGDVIVFNKDGEEHVGRIVAIAGDTVCINNDGYVEINGYKQQDSDFYETYIDSTKEGNTYVIDNDSFYVLGDNRPESYDSRDFGEVKKGEIVGKVITIIRKDYI